MKSKKEKTYIAPFLRLAHIEIENAIIASSAVSIMGGKNDDYTPDVEDWKLDDQESNGWEM